MAARNSDLLERITAVLESLAQNNQANQANPPQGQAENNGLAEFRRMDPPRFEGGFNPEGAQRWLQDVEKIFRTMNCADTQKMVFATYMLVGDAENWWEHTKQLLEAEHGGYHLEDVQG